MSTTFVSAFMCNISSNKWSNTSLYIKKFTQHFIPLVKSDVNKIIFIDTDVYDFYKNYENHNTKIIPFDKKSNYLYNYSQYITDFKANNSNSEKDTVEYMFTMCHKTEWLKMAISYDQGKSDQYIWIDFGIKYFLSYTEEEFMLKLKEISKKIYNKIRISHIWHLNFDYILHYNLDIYKNILWYFAGSIFGGDAKSIIDFADKMKQKCISIIKEKNTIMWEVNIWYMIFIENPLLFDAYICNHDNTIIESY
jgi:hypothetical protein